MSSSVAVFFIDFYILWQPLLQTKHPFAQLRFCCCKATDNCRVLFKNILFRHQRCCMYISFACRLRMSITKKHQYVTREVLEEFALPDEDHKIVRVSVHFGNLKLRTHELAHHQFFIGNHADYNSAFLVISLHKKRRIAVP